MSPPRSAAAKPQRQLGLFDATCIIVGIIIGSGIYKTTPLIALNAASANWLIAAWVLGGVVALLGAMCYAELTTTYPEEGGDYVFLNRAFGRHAGFLFAWAEYWIVRPGNIGMMAFVFATFAQGLFAGITRQATPPSGNWIQLEYVAYAVGSVVVLTILNVLGVHTGKTTQNVLATIKVLGLMAIVFVGLFVTSAHPVESKPTNALGGDFRLAMILVLFTYGGWNEVTFVAAEVKRPERNLFWALLLGITTVTALYVLVNVAFLRTLGLQGTAAADQVAADVFEKPFGAWGSTAMNLLVCISALGSINGMLFTGARIYYAVGNDHRAIGWLGKWSGRMDSPVRALLLQALITVALIAGFGWYQEGFLRLTYFTSPVYWFFAFMVGVSLMILRWRDKDKSRPHSVWFYPWTPLLFSLTCAVLCESSFTYALSNQHWEALWALGLMLAGAAIALMTNRKRES